MTNLYEQIGGEAVLKRVHKVFYDELYKHPWLKQFFTDLDQEIIESQQSKFMSGLFGGPAVYGGKSPHDAHAHIMVTEEMLDLRTKILRQSILKCGLSEEIADAWLVKDLKFHRTIIKKSTSELKRRFPTQNLVHFPNTYKS